MPRSRRTSSRRLSIRLAGNQVDFPHWHDHGPSSSSAQLCPVLAILDPGARRTRIVRFGSIECGGEFFLGDFGAAYRIGHLIAQLDADAADRLAGVGDHDLLEQVDTLNDSRQLSPQQSFLLLQNFQERLPSAPLAQIGQSLVDPRRRAEEAIARLGELHVAKDGNGHASHVLLVDQDLTRLGPRDHRDASPISQHALRIGAAWFPLHRAAAGPRAAAWPRHEA